MLCVLLLRIILYACCRGTYNSMHATFSLRILDKSDKSSNMLQVRQIKHCNQFPYSTCCIYFFCLVCGCLLKKKNFSLPKNHSQISSKNSLGVKIQYLIFSLLEIIPNSMGLELIPPSNFFKNNPYLSSVSHRCQECTRCTCTRVNIHTCTQNMYTV